MPNSWDPQNQFKNGKSHTHLGQPIGDPYRIPKMESFIELFVIKNPLCCDLYCSKSNLFVPINAHHTTPHSNAHLQTTPHSSKAAMVGFSKREGRGRVPVALENQPIYQGGFCWVAMRYEAENGMQPRMTCRLLEFGRLISFTEAQRVSRQVCPWLHLVLFLSCVALKHFKSSKICIHVSSTKEL